MMTEHQTDNRTAWKIINLHGPLDFRHSASAWKLLDETVRRHDRVSVDLSDVTYIDSSGVASIIEAYRTAKQNGARIRLVGVNQQAMRMFELNCLSEVLSIQPQPSSTRFSTSTERALV